jgi:hypothetical protein
MICYQLRCGRGHGFEGWFRGSDAFAEEVRRLTCPICDDRSIEKAIMAPAVLLRGSAAEPDPSHAAPQSDEQAEVAPTSSAGSASGAAVSPSLPAPVAAVPKPAPDRQQLAQALTLMRKLQAHVEANFENVGRRFAEEARKIHLEESEPRGIYGEASPEEVRSLEEDGIAVAPLPRLPKLDG